MPQVAGQRTGFGNPLWLQTHPVASTTAAAVQALLNAGATLKGKTHMDELAYRCTHTAFAAGTHVCYYDSQDCEERDKLGVFSVSSLQWVRVEPYASKVRRAEATHMPAAAGTR